MNSPSCNVERNYMANFKFLWQYFLLGIYYSMGRRCESWIVNIVWKHGYIEMCDVLSYRSDHLFRPFLAKNEKYQNNMYRKKKSGFT